MMELKVPTRAWSQYQAGVLDENGRPVPIEQHAAESKAGFRGHSEFVEQSNLRVDDDVIKSDSVRV